MKLQLMDYSLLLGVHDCEKAEQENLERLERPERKSTRTKSLSCFGGLIDHRVSA